MAQLTATCFDAGSYRRPAIIPLGVRARLIANLETRDTTLRGATGIRTPNLFLAKELRYRCAMAPLRFNVSPDGGGRLLPISVHHQFDFPDLLVGSNWKALLRRRESNPRGSVLQTRRPKPGALRIVLCYHSSTGLPALSSLSVGNFKVVASGSYCLITS